jgi:hypothetical protein
LILAGTFSEDMITTGMSFKEDDPWTEGRVCLWMPKQKERIQKSHLDPLEQVVAGHARHAVVSDDQVHIDLLQPRVGGRSHVIISANPDAGPADRNIKSLHYY